MIRLLSSKMNIVRHSRILFSSLSAYSLLFTAATISTTSQTATAFALPSSPNNSNRKEIHTATTAESDMSTTATTTTATSTTCSAPAASTIPSLDPDRVKVIEESGPGRRIVALEPLGAQVYGFDLEKDEPSKEVLEALEMEMANRGFLVFKGQQGLTVDGFLRGSCWFGGKEIHSTHGVHPATPNMNRDIFRLANDRTHGILGVGKNLLQHWQELKICE